MDYPAYHADLPTITPGVLMRPERLLEALAHGPVLLTNNGEPFAVIMRPEEFDRLEDNQPPI